MKLRSRTAFSVSTLLYLIFLSHPCSVLANETAREPRVRIDRNKVIFGGPVNERIFQHNFHEDSPSCGEEEFTIKISKGSVQYFMNDGSSTKIKWKQDGSQIVVGQDDCAIRIFINRPPITNRCQDDKCG